MRVLFWSEPFWPSIGGVQVFTAKLLPALQERGHEFVVITRREPLNLAEEGQFKDIPLYRFPFLPALRGELTHLLTVRQKIAKLKRMFAPDLIHINSFGLSVFFHLDTLKIHPAPVLVTLHAQGHPKPSGPGTLLEKTLRTADWVTGCSAWMVEYERQIVPELSSRSSVVYNGLQVPPLLPEPLPFNPPRLLCLGRLVFYKGIDLALTAFAAITARFPGARLVIAGDGPARSDLERQAVELRLTHAVDFIGWVEPEGVPALINTATMIVLPSWGEGLPLTALEAAFMARPVVATRVGGIPEVVVQQKTGLLVEKDDCAGLAKAMASLLASPGMAIQLGHAARRRAIEVFGFERCVEAYDTLYRKLTRGAH